MTHPLYHSQDSQKLLGGDFNRHLEVHTWIDGTKIYFADARHRSLRHVREILFNRYEDLDLKIALAHVLGDCDGFVPTLDDWAGTLKLKDWMVQTETKKVSDYLISKYGGSPESYEGILDYFTTNDNPRYGYLKQHSLGIFEAESELGQQIFLDDQKWVPTRYVAEQIVLKINKFPGIPSVSDWLRNMKREAWMNRPKAVLFSDLSSEQALIE